MELVALTGGTGLIGSHVAERFAAEGVALRALVRRAADTSLLERLGADLVFGDVTDPASLDRAFAGATSVIHTAGRVSDWGPYEEFEAVNVGGTRKVLEAAVRAGIRKVIVTGSNSSYGEEHCPVAKSEDSPFAWEYPYFARRVLPSAMNHYRRSKAEATRVALEMAVSEGLDVTVIEPVFVFGEREFHSGFYSYLAEVRRGAPVLPGCSDNLFHVVYARDLAGAYWLAHRAELRGANRFIVGNPEVDTMDRVFSCFCDAAGLRRPPRAPKWALYPVGLAMELLWTIAGAKSPPTLTRARVNMFYDSIRYDVDRARRLLGFVASTPLEEAIGRTVAWYKEHGHL